MCSNVVAAFLKSTGRSLFAGRFRPSHARVQRADVSNTDTRPTRSYGAVATRASADRAGIRAMSDEHAAEPRPTTARERVRQPARTRGPGTRSPRRDSRGASQAPAAAKPQRGRRRRPQPRAGRGREPTPRREPRAATRRGRASREAGGGLEDIAWAGVAAAAEAATLGVRLASRAIEALRGNSESASDRDARPVASVSRQASTRFLRVFWERAYRENITGLAAMVAYNLALALFPFALLVLFIFGQVIQNPDVEASVLRDLQSIFPAAEQNSLTEHRRPDPRQLDDDRRRRRGRRDLDRRLVLGGDGHRLLPHLPRRVPRLGRAEALRAGDAGRGHDLPRRQRRHPGRRGRCSPRAPRTCRSGSTRSASCAASALLGGRAAGSPSRSAR